MDWDQIKMKTYSEKLKDPRWQKKRLDIFSRDKWQCRDCGCSSKTLEVHHSLYRKGQPWEIEDIFLITVCSDCHEIRQSEEDGIKEACALVCAKSSIEELKNFGDKISGVASQLTTEDRIKLMSEGWLTENRWIDYAEIYPTFRPFVEMVLGQVVKWGKAS